MGRNKLTLNEKKILRTVMIRNKLPMSKEREYQLYLVKNKRLYTYDQQSTLSNDDHKDFINDLILHGDNLP